MDEKPDQIINHIESQRDQLGRNLNELESRVKGATDWRTQFDRNPMLMMGLALGGGLLIGTMTGSSRKSSRSTSTPWSTSSRYSGASSSTPIGSSSSSYSSSPASSFGSSSTSPAIREQRKKATDTLEHIKAAMIGFATAKVKEFLHEALPGFETHLEEAERRHSSSSSSQPDQSQQHQHHSEANPATGSAGSARSEYSGQSPYRQEPVGVNTGSNI